MAQIQISNEDPTSRRRLPPPPPPPQRRKMPKVPELFLREGQCHQDYIPKVVSIGPYHHGKSELRLVESFKPVALEMVLSDDKGKQEYYYEEIRGKIVDIRDCYEEHPTDLYSDDELAQMMLLDACFIIVQIDMPSQNIWRMLDYLDILTMATAAIRDITLLENQIPFWIVKLLLGYRYTEEESRELINRFLTRIVLKESGSIRSLPVEDEDEDEEELHLLDAFHRFLIFDCVHQPKKTCMRFNNCRLFNCFRAKEKTVDERINNACPTIDPESIESCREKSRFQSYVNESRDRAWKRLIKKDSEGDYAKIDIKEFTHSFRSVTDLKAKGIRLKPSPTHSFKDVQFKSNWIYAKLQLPIQFASLNSKVFFLNVIAFELANSSEFVVISYINFMKSLIVRPEDVKELREKKILFCSSESDKQVLKMYRDINTYGVNNLQIYKDVKDRIQAHYNSKSKTWIAELIHTYIRSPWTVITLLAATCLLVLTFLQTIYTMKS